MTLGPPIILSETGSGDMGSMLYGSRTGIAGAEVYNTNGKARTSLADGGAFALVEIRVHFTGAVGTADMAIRIDSHRGTAHDLLIETVRDVGSGADAHWWVPEDQQATWVLEASDEAVLTWTDPGTTVWGLTWTLRPVLPDLPRGTPIVQREI